MLSPDNRVIMISGANRGIGLACAQALSKRGYSLSLGARTPGNIDRKLAGQHALCTRWDATDPASANSWAQATLERFGRIDGIVMNAGVGHNLQLEEADETALDEMWEVNYKGPLRLIRAVMPSLRVAGHGRVISIVSLSGKRLLGTRMFGYAATKFAALSLVHAVRHEGWDDGVRATAICPGLVDTRMVDHVEPPPGEFKIDPATIGETAAYALSLPDNASVAEILINSRMETMF